MLSRASFAGSRFLSKSAPFGARALATSAAATNLKPPVRVAITGAAGQIGYALLFRIASGEMLGKDQPVILQLLELPDAVNRLKGTAMELDDCAFPLVRKIIETSDEKVAFEGADYALLVGSRPRTQGMERGDLLAANGKIFTSQGKALNAVANRDTLRVLVVGNPANTNCLIAAQNAPNIDPRRFTAMTRLDHNRGLAQLAAKTGSAVTDIEKFAIWGNHSATQVPDITHTTIKGKAASSLVDAAWVSNNFIPDVQQRGAAILKARGSSSAASAASAAIDHIRDWVHGTKGQWTSMAVFSDGSYGADKGLYFSFPITTTENGQYRIVQGLNLDANIKERFEKTRAELVQEKQLAEKA